jgi:hypothetical protein
MNPPIPLRSITLSTASRILYLPQPRYTLSQPLLIPGNMLWTNSYLGAKFALQERSVLPMLAHGHSERMLGDLLVILALLVMSSYSQNRLSPLILLGGLLVIASACIISRRCKKTNTLRREDGMSLC